jgi:hypothetical protein
VLDEGALGVPLARERHGGRRDVHPARVEPVGGERGDEIASAGAGIQDAPAIADRLAQQPQPRLRVRVVERRRPLAPPVRVVVLARAQVRSRIFSSICQ